MENRELAHRYANALMKLDPKGEVESDVELMSASIHKSRHVIMVFLDPMVHGATKLAALRKAFGPMHPNLAKFLDFVQFKNRMDHLPLILVFYLSLRRKARGLLQGEVRTASELTVEQLRHIELVVGKKLDKHCEFIQKPDASLIGGFTVHIEDTVYDCSVRNRLEQVRTRFLNLAG